MAQIKLKRGTASTIPALADGEPGWCQDTHQLYVGSAAGNVLISGGGGGGAGTVTSISQGTGLTLTPNPITATGTVALTVPVAVANGGTGATTAAAGLANLGGQPLDGDLTSLAAASATNSLYFRSAADTWSTVTIGSGLTFSGGILATVTTNTAVWRYSNNTTMADPGAGNYRLNNALFVSATQIAIDILTDGGADVTNFLKTLVTGDIVQFQDESNSANWVRYHLTGTPTNNTGWFLLPVAPDASGGTAVTNNTPCLVMFTVTGAGGGGGGGVPTTRLINTVNSLTGGGDLSADRTLALVNDATTPGNSMVYGTNPSGTRGWYSQSAVGSSVILSGAGPPADALGVVGNLYEDTVAGILYGPKTVAGAATEDTLTLATAGSNVSAEVGLKILFPAAGTVTRFRYSRLATSGGTITFNVWNTDSGNTLVVSYNDGGAHAGVAGTFDFVLPTPLVIGSGNTRLFTYNGSGGGTTPYNPSSQINTVYQTFQGNRSSGTLNAYPAGNSLGASGSCMIPVFVPSATWIPSVRQLYAPYSILSDPAQGIQLVNDSAAPGNNFFYGTNASGVKGWYGRPATFGTVTSVAVAGGTTGLTTSGGPITTSGTITLAGTLALANGGTGQTTANAALGALLPAQTGNANKVLATDATNATWQDWSTLGSAVDLALTDILPVYHSGNARVAADRLLAYAHPGRNDFRLSLLGDPVADQTTAANLYLVPYTGNRICLFDGTRWRLYNSGIVAFAMGSLSWPYPMDVFVYDNAGTVTLDWGGWQTATTRYTANDLVLQDGVWVRADKLNYRYLGSLFLDGAGTTQDTPQRRLIWNFNNRVRRKVAVSDATSSWTDTNTAWHQVRSSATNYLQVLGGLINGKTQSVLDLTAGIVWSCSAASTTGVQTALGEDVTNNPTGTDYALRTDVLVAGLGHSSMARLTRLVPAGVHSYNWLCTAAAAGTTTFYGPYGGVVGFYDC